MKSVRKIVAWLAVILLALGAGGGWYAYSLWTRSDEILREKIQEACQEIVPDWNLEVGRARFDFQGRIRVYDFKLRYPADSPFVHLPETIVVADREKLVAQKLEIQQIQLLNPQLILTRDRQGRWNFEGLPGPMIENPHPPEWIIDQGTIHLRMAPPGSRTPADLVLRNVNLKLVPAGKQRYVLQGTVAVDHAGEIRLGGEWDIEAGSWALNGALRGVNIGTDLLQLAGRISPAVRERIAQATAGSTARQTADYADYRGEPAFAIDLNSDVHFRVAQAQPDAEWEYKVLLKVLTGQLTHPRLPFSLHDLQARLYLDNRQFVVRDLQGQHGLSQLRVNARVLHQAEERPTELIVQLQDLVVDERLNERLPETLQEVYETVQPTGRMDAHVTARYDSTNGWQLASDLTVKDATARHIKFPYEIERIRGSIRAAGGVCEIALTGAAGERPVQFQGRVQRRGAEYYRLHVQDLPLDETLVAAAPEPMRRTFESLGLQGVANVDCHFARSSPDEPYKMQLYSEVRDGTVRFDDFPYPLANVSGTVKYRDHLWTFTDLRGTHGSGTVTAKGTFLENDDEDLLDLTIESQGSDFDNALRLALNPTWRRTWDEFSPTGKFNSQTRILWTPGSPPQLAISVDVLNGAFSMKSFPYPLQDVTTTLQMVDKHLTISRFSARHEDTQVRLHGWGEFDDSGEWRVRLEELIVDDLEPNRHFRRALPPGFREVVENLDPRGRPISFSGMLEFRGTGNPQDYVTSAWDLEIVHAGGKVTAGVDLDNLYGRVITRGKWDGERVISRGQVDFDSLTILGYQFTKIRGPVSINGNQLVIGSKKVANLAGTTGGAVRVPTEERISARAIEGVFTLDGIAVLDESMSYRVLITLNGGKLERYAQLYMPSRATLQGVMNAWVELSGRGAHPERIKGRGQLQISPAALYELPVIVSIFNILKFLPPDKTAFNHALVNFDVGGSKYHLREIDLVGNAISLRGRGTVGFDGKVSLDFYSTVARNQLGGMPLPLVKTLLGEATSGLIGVEVRGTTQDPIAKVVPVPKLEPIRRFLEAFEPRPIAQPPFPANPRAPVRQ